MNGAIRGPERFPVETVLDVKIEIEEEKEVIAATRAIALQALQAVHTHLLNHREPRDTNVLSHTV